MRHTLHKYSSNACFCPPYRACVPLNITCALWWLWWWFYVDDVRAYYKLKHQNGLWKPAISTGHIFEKHNVICLTLSLMRQTITHKEERINMKDKYQVCFLLLVRWNNFGDNLIRISDVSCTETKDTPHAHNASRANGLYIHTKGDHLPAIRRRTKPTFSI